MMTNLFRRIMVVAVAAAALLTGGVQAQASSAPATGSANSEVLLPAAPADVDVQASYTFSRSATERIYTAFHNSGVAGVIAACVVIAPGWVKVIGCPVFGQVVAAFLPGQPPEGRCLQVYTRWGWPPLGVRYVSC